MAILVKNCRLIDGVSEQPRDEVDVLVEGRTISRIGVDLAPPIDGRVIDASDKTLLPGLIDVHVHLTFDGSLDSVGHLVGESPYVTLLKAARNAALTLRRGVTTVRDLGGPSGIPYALRDSIRAGIAPGPRILTSGQVITHPLEAIVTSWATKRMTLPACVIRRGWR
jgi:imidazolonepropionase-like amidohydrolase